MPVEGIDVSHWQGDVDWPAVKKSGRKFVFLKATEGKSMVDEKFEQNWDAAHAAGLLCGAYHFADPKSGAKAQARHLHRTVSPQSGDLPLVLDLESGEEIGPQRLEKWVRDFVEEITKLTGAPPIIYSGGFWKSHLNHLTDNLGCPLWLPQYGPRAEPPRAWTTWTFWQYSDGSINAARLKPVPGVGQNCDRNRFAGSVRDLRKLVYDEITSTGRKKTRRRERTPAEDEHGGERDEEEQNRAGLTVREVQEILRGMGWPLEVDGEMGGDTFAAVKDFQRAFAWWDLLIDGNVGPKTAEALRYAAKHEGRASLHFRFAEFKSKGNGWIRVHRSLIRGLEEVRDKVGPLSILSGHRDPAHNSRVGGAASSQHLHGNACDTVKDLPLDVVKGVKRFSGIGIRRSDNKVRHVDVRHEGPNTTGGTPENPTIWFYA